MKRWSAVISCAWAIACTGPAPGTATAVDAAADTTANVPHGAPICPDLTDCLEECGEDAPVILCLLGCSDSAGAACNACVLAGLDACLQPECPSIAQALRTCLDGCDGSPWSCTQSACKQQTLHFEACGADPTASGACQPHLSACMGP